MKAYKTVLLLIITLSLVLAGCKRDLGFTPDGNYLELSIRFPESGTSESSRLIHSQSDELYISLTYPDGDVEKATFTRDSSDSSLSVLLEDLRVSNNVELYISLGLSEYEIPLSEVTTTINIKAGANTPSLLTLLPITYSVTGTLTNSSNAILSNHSITLNDSTNITTDSSGHFSLTVSSEDLEDYVKFKIVDTETYELARTNLYLIQNRNNLTLKASPEIYLDFFVRSEQFALPGTSFEIMDTDESFFYSGTADGYGRIFYQKSDHTTAALHSIYLNYNNLFESHTIVTPGAPGAVVDDVILNPYPIFTVYRDSQDYYLYYLDEYETMIPTSDLISLLGITLTSRPIMAVDYKNGIIYFATGAISGTPAIYSTTDMYSGATNDFDITPLLSYNDSSIQQLLVLKNGNLLVATAECAFIYDTKNKTSTTVWEGSNSGDSYPFIVNGVYESDDGSLFALGTDHSSNTASSQRIYKLNSNGTISESNSLSGYNEFADYGTAIYQSSFYYYLLGLFSVGSKMVSVQYRDSANPYGQIVFYDDSGSTWPTDGSPIRDTGSTNSSSYIVPVGVLPDNRFYCIEETYVETDTKKLLRLNDANTKSISVFDIYTNGSGAKNQNNTLYYNYSEPS